MWRERFPGSWSVYRDSYGSGDGLAGGIAFAGAIVIVMIVLVVFLLWKAIDLVIRAWIQSRGKSQALKVVLFTWFAELLLLGLCGVCVANNVFARYPMEAAAIALGILLGITTIALLITARVVELKYRTLFANEPAPLVQQVLHRPWWTSNKVP